MSNQPPVQQPVQPPVQQPVQPPVQQPVQKPFIPKSVAAGFGGCIGVGCALVLIPLLIFLAIMIVGMISSA